MFLCPKCNVTLLKTNGNPGVFWRCPSCDGRTSTISVLRQNVPRTIVNTLWQQARNANNQHKRRCPACNNLMAEVRADEPHQTEYLDVCTICQFVWFDASEYESLPTLPKKLTVEERLPQEAREKLAVLKIKAIKEVNRSNAWDSCSPDSWWQWIAGILGMPVEYDAPHIGQKPLVTWLIALLATIVTAITFSDLDNVIQNLGLIPSNFDRYAGLTFITSFFLHGGIFHLIGNMYFFLIFGDNVEDWLGKWRFVLLLICATVIGDIAHIIAEPGSMTPCVGASGGISGVIAFYALKFPRTRLLILFWFRWLRIPAYAMFLMWFAMQLLGAWKQLSGFSYVSYLAHLGGAGVGVIFWFFSRNFSEEDLAGHASEQHGRLHAETRA